MSMLSRAALFGIMMTFAMLTQADTGVVFKTLEGEAQTVESHTGKGKWVVVKIWAADCHICNAEAETYAQFHEAQGEDGIRMLGLSMDGDARKAGDYVERHDLPFPNLLGDPRSVSNFYMGLTKQPLLGTPTILVFDPKGEMVAAQAGPVPPEAIERFVAQRSEAEAAS
ncbi:MAG: TlpA family protein disulfide reductase [Proteobacteria bacterium]|nr:TlpA family protein disulfide reductase [Pseudomonadota bacterium]